MRRRAYNRWQQRSSCRSADGLGSKSVWTE
jgi:hypothetical protein